MSKLKFFGQAILVGALGILPTTGAYSQASYPAAPIRFIVPFATGGGTDIVSRILAQELATSLGKPVVVENKPGANGIIGTTAALQAAPDGYTVVLALEATVAMNPGLYKGVNYKTADFAPISLVSKQPYLVVANPSVKANNLSELISLAKKNPGHMNYATGAAAAFLAGELLKSTTGMDILNIPYKGSGEAISDVLSGRVQLMLSSPVSVMPHIKSGKLKVLAVTSGERYHLLPNVPTVAEQGYPSFDVAGWYGLAAPKGTPASVVNRLNAAVATALKSPELLERFELVGVEPAQNSPEEFGHYMQADTDRWAAVIKKSGIQKQ